MTPPLQAYGLVFTSDDETIRDGAGSPVDAAALAGVRLPEDVTAADWAAWLRAWAALHPTSQAFVTIDEAAGSLPGPSAYALQSAVQHFADLSTEEWQLLCVAELLFLEMARQNGDETGSYPIWLHFAHQHVVLALARLRRWKDRRP